MALILQAGMDSVIMNPEDRGTSRNYDGSRSTSWKGPSLLNFIRAFRGGKIGPKTDTGP